MARGHVLSGLVAGCGLVACIPAAPVPVRLLTVAVTGGAALLPDLDHPGSTAARSLGVVTRLIAKGVNQVALAVYFATRTDGDPASRGGGHRLLTHTPTGCLLASLFASLACLAHPLAGGVLLGLLGGLMALGMKWAGPLLAGGCGFGGWWVLDTSPGWGWWFGLAVLVGALSHVSGDACTNSGVPLWWPLTVGGRRWRLVTAPLTFDTGGAEERRLVTPLLWVALGVSGGAVSGVLSVVWSAVAAAWGGGA